MVSVVSASTRALQDVNNQVFKERVVAGNCPAMGLIAKCELRIANFKVGNWRVVHKYSVCVHIIP